MQDLSVTALPVERIAAITAALAMMLDQPVGSFVVTSIRPEPVMAPTAGLWAKVGLLESHLSRRQFGLRTR